MGALEQFIHEEHSPYPTLVNAALAHVQFETIHPFLDGNGRIGRLLIAFILHDAATNGHDELDPVGFLMLLAAMAAAIALLVGEWVLVGRDE